MFTGIIMFTGFFFARLTFGLTMSSGLILVIDRFGLVRSTLGPIGIGSLVFVVAGPRITAAP